MLRSVTFARRLKRGLSAQLAVLQDEGEDGVEGIEREDYVEYQKLAYALQLVGSNMDEKYSLAVDCVLLG